MRALTLAGSVLVAACVAVGCSEKTKQEAREAGQEATEAARAAGDAAQSAAQDAVNNAERAGDAAVDAARDVKRDSDDAVQQASRRTQGAEDSLKQAGRNTRDAANEVADAAGAAAQTAKVKAAFVADSKVDAAGIDVDTDAQTKTIVLKGHVPSAAQKAAAGRIAADKASKGYTVRNDLVVHP